MNIPAATWGQLLRFGVVGVASNAVLYLLYLGMTHLGLRYEAAITALYAVGIAQTFVFNRSWSFGHQGGLRRSMARYVAVYLLCYVLNFALLRTSVEYFGLDHAIVQAAAILPFAILVFLLQKYWVFAATPARPAD